MKKNLTAVTAAMFLSFSLFAQGPGQPGMGRPGGQPQLPPEVIATLTYHEGYRLARNIQENAPEDERDHLFSGLRAVLSGEEPDTEMVAYFNSTFFQGAQMAMQAGQQGLNPETVLLGISDHLADFEPRHTQAEADAAMETLQTFMMTMQQGMAEGQPMDQEPPEEALTVISYQQGVELGKQVASAELEEEETAQFVAGFTAAVQEDLDMAKHGWFQGYQIGGQLLQQGADPAQLMQAVTDVLAGNDPAFSPEEIAAARQVIEGMQQQQQAQMQEMQQRQMAEMQEQAARNQEAGEAFLRENAAREDVVTTLSGLQYEVLEAGEGDKPEASDTVTVHYTGRLLDGTVFDSSVERGEPTSFPLNRVIPGWTEGVQLMSPGARYRFWIPADLAYGMQAPPSIGPNQVLDFEVELISIED